jgi:hypothetical protein
MSDKRVFTASLLTAVLIAAGAFTLRQFFAFELAKRSLKNKVYKMDVARYSVASARLYGDGDEGATSENGATLAAGAGHVE